MCRERDFIFRKPKVNWKASVKVIEFKTYITRIIKKTRTYFTMRNIFDNFSVDTLRLRLLFSAANTDVQRYEGFLSSHLVISHLSGYVTARRELNKMTGSIILWDEIRAVMYMYFCNVLQKRNRQRSQLALSILYKLTPDAQSFEFKLFCDL